MIVVDLDANGDPVPRKIGEPHVVKRQALSLRMQPSQVFSQLEVLHALLEARDSGDLPVEACAAFPKSVYVDINEAMAEIEGPTLNALLQDRRAFRYFAKRELKFANDKYDLDSTTRFAKSLFKHLLLKLERFHHCMVVLVCAISLVSPVPR